MTTNNKGVALIKNNILIVLLLTLIILVGMALFRFERIAEEVANGKPKYHFFVVAQNSVDPFWKEVRRGVEVAARDYHVAVEFTAPRFNNSEEQLRYLDIAVLARVDGIVTHVANEADFNGLIDKAYDQGIPVVTIENDAGGSKRKAFVGTNSFLLGELAGGLMARATNGKGNIAIIVNNDVQTDTTSKNLKISGFLHAVKAYPEMEVVKVYTSMLGIISAEEITQSITGSQPAIDAIYTVDTVDTLGVAQALVDFNQVGNMVLVGYGDTPEILRYIEKGIVYGTVMSNPYLMGYQSIKSLMEIKEKDNVSTFVDTEIKTITAETLDAYRQGKTNGR
ncbi:MAG: substrate-binding domain-containing protein [Firmicutes bacterium]|nr:substrate-binding domain-containing protein [Bacillota bacterium]